MPSRSKSKMQSRSFIINVYILLSFSSGCGISHDKSKMESTQDSVISPAITKPDYFSSFPASNVLIAKNWRTICDSMNNFTFAYSFYNSKQFRYLLNHKTDAIAAFTADTVQDMIDRAFSAALINARNEKDDDQVYRIKNEIREFCPADSSLIFPALFVKCPSK